MPITRASPKKNASYASNRLSSNIPESWSLHGQRLRRQTQGKNDKPTPQRSEVATQDALSEDGSPFDAPPKSDSDSEELETTQNRNDKGGRQGTSPASSETTPKPSRTQKLQDRYGSKNGHDAQLAIVDSSIEPASSDHLTEKERDVQLDAWAMEQEQPLKKRRLNRKSYGYQCKFRAPTMSNGASKPSLKDEQPVFRAPLSSQVNAEKEDKPTFKTMSIDVPHTRRSTRSKQTEVEQPAFQKRELDSTLLNKLDRGQQVAGDIFKARDVERLIQDLPPQSSTSSLSTNASTFSAPQILDDDVNSILASPLTTPPESPSPPSTPYPNGENDDLETAETKCPICKKLVPTAALKSFSSNTNRRPEGRLDIHEQQKFCTWHKSTDAQSLYSSRGYPRFTPEDWTSLAKTRIPSHFPHLTQIITNDARSHYRIALNRIAESGDKSLLRTFLRDLSIDLPTNDDDDDPNSPSAPDLPDPKKHTALPGYYGPRGRAIFSSAIIRHFSPMLNQLAARDRLVKRIGVAGYVQTVLVPELAVRLIVEDRRELREGTEVDGEAMARKVLDESVEVGEEVNREEDEEVFVGGDEGGGSMEGGDNGDGMEVY
ncbi:MAG: hypothetical protein Q9160_006527 [Pyrenula sp. 1 TL-2023]